MLASQIGCYDVIDLIYKLLGIHHMFACNAIQFDGQP